MASTPFPEGPSFLDRGRSLTLVGEVLSILGWLFAMVAIMAGVDLGLIALVLMLTGILVTAIGFFRASRLGRFALAAGWVQAGGFGLALILFLGIPGSGEWGKLGAFIVALIALGFTNAIAHLLASLGLRENGFPIAGTAGLSASTVAIVAGIAAFAIQEPGLHAAAIMSVVAHASVLAGMLALHPRAPR